MSGKCILNPQQKIEIGKLDYCGTEGGKCIKEWSQEEEEEEEENLYNKKLMCPLSGS